jgi:hypothetical protein
LFARLLAPVITALTLVALTAPSLSAQQNLSVRPMRVEADVPANRTARVVLRVNNRHATRQEPINLSVVDLSQNSDGTLRVITDEMREEMDPEAFRASSRQWIELPAERIVIPPETTQEIPVLLDVPPDARGAFASGIMIRTDAPETPEGEEGEQTAVFAISFGFLIPLITEIEGRPVRQDISIGNVRMEFDDGRNAEDVQVSEPTTRAFMEIANDGQTYSELRGEVVVERRTGENWRTVTRAALPERSILPGLELDLSADLDRRLPSGEYRLLGNLEVDGRRLPRFERVIDFEGDPEADSVAFDTALTLSPPRLALAAVPGATRTNTIEVGNPGEAPLDVTIEITTPESLRGVAMGEMRGEDISAAPWSEALPAEFTLRGRQSRNVRVLSRMPRDGMEYANYYADITLTGRYADGQSAGQTNSRLHIRQQQVGNAPAGILDQMGVSISEEADYIVQSRFVNTGNVDMEPQVQAELIDESGNVVSRAVLTGEPGQLLPLGTRSYAGTVGIGDVPLADYTLRVVAAHEGTRLFDRQLPVRISLVAEGTEDEPEVREMIILDE